MTELLVTCLSVGFDVGVWIFCLLVFYAVSILLHEAGHAALACLCGLKLIQFSIGRGEILFSKGFLEVRAHVFNVVSISVEYPKTALQDLAIAAGGPLVTLSLVGIGAATGHLALVLPNIVIAVLCLTPRTVNGNLTDGLQLLNCVKVLRASGFKAPA